MDKKIIISGFADEIDPQLDVQLKVVKDLGMEYICFRAADGKLTFPFRWITYPKKDAKTLVATINSYFIRGLTALPREIEKNEGAYLAISNWNALRPCEISFHLMRQACLWSGTNPFSALKKSERELFIKHVGSEAFFNALARDGAKINIRAWYDLWDKQARLFQLRIKKYWLYA